MGEGPSGKEGSSYSGNKAYCISRHSGHCNARANHFKDSYGVASSGVGSEV